MLPLGIHNFNGDHCIQSIRIEPEEVMFPHGHCVTVLRRAHLPFSIFLQSGSRLPSILRGTNACNRTHESNGLWCNTHIEISEYLLECLLVSQEFYWWYSCFNIQTRCTQTLFLWLVYGSECLKREI